MEIKKNVNVIANNIDNKNVLDLITSISGDGETYIEISSLEGTNILSSSNTKYKISLPNKITMISKAKDNNNDFYQEIIDSPPEKPTGNKNFIGELPPVNMPPQGSNGNKNFTQELPPTNMKPAQSLMYLKLVKNSSGETVAVFMNAVISPLDATVKTLRYQLYLVTGIMLVLSILLALIIAKKISRPIEEINKSAKQLGSGNYDIHFNGKGFLEIAELSKTLNTAAVELNKAEVLRHELLANISHDLRTPLSLIYSYAEMIHDFPDEVTPDQTQVIMDETQRLKTLVNDVLDISKLESGTQRLSLSKYNFTDSVKNTTERIAELIKKNKYSISFVRDKEVFICADEARITQALYNLLINAINYTGEDKTIIVGQIVSDENVRIEVTDTGDGITPENLPYIWDRYYKVDKKHKRAIMGTGLGLSIVKKVIELHGGNFGVESQVGSGSTFWFELKTDKLS
ncbi:sensor histidine kinase [Clostridium thailandense]|uniref:sensor histidine kinase n=1 Tax=Clostridium thailandense TaxID=2794346 RepID=UPI0039892F98